MPKVPAGSRYYAVAKGRQPGLYYTWEDCQAQVDGFSGARHKKVRTYEEAKAWLASHGVALEEQASPSPPSTPLAGPSVPKSSKPTSTSTSEGRTVQPKPSPSSKEPRAGPSQRANRLVGSGTKLPEQSTAYVSVIEPTVVNCDGACKGNGQPGSVAGVGVFWGEGDERNIAERCPGAQTNNRAELIAIVRVLQTAPVDDAPLIIRTDSHYSIKCVTKWLSNWRLRKFRTANGKPVSNKELICYIDALLEERRQAEQKVSFEHVYGHQGDPGNEGADGQANKGCWLPEIPEDEDWESLERETRARIAERKEELERMDEEMLLEAMSDDIAVPMDPEDEDGHESDHEIQVDVDLPSTPPPPPMTPPATVTKARELSKKLKASPFKPAKVDTPQFRTPTSSPSRTPAAAVTTAAAAATTAATAVAAITTTEAKLTKEELEVSTVSAV
ncbi:ribonuclease H-like domain-containing protein [Irpex lacteus]|nr:ribonuclease H-like domain-containing protein [Irpex lacteus]